MKRSSLIWFYFKFDINHLVTKTEIICMRINIDAQMVKKLKILLPGSTEKTVNNGTSPVAHSTISIQ